MDQSLFSRECVIPKDCLLKVKDLINILSLEIIKNEGILQLYLIWKKIGYRISDDEYISSKQQIRKENPNDQNLMKIFSIECVISLFLRTLAIKKIKTDCSFSSIELIESNLKSMGNSEFSFLFEEDVYDIWKYLKLTQELNKFNSLLNEVLPKILDSMKELQIEQIFLILHQEILDQKSRKLMGEFYTPIELSQIVVNKGIPFLNKEKLIIDLSCGSGSLLLTYLRKRQSTLKNNDFDHVIGLDINPLAIIMTKFALSFFQYNLGMKIENPFVFCVDSLVIYSNFKTKNIITKKTNLQDFLAITKSTPLSQNINNLRIEFLRSIYDIKINQNLEKNLKTIRIKLKDEIKKAMRNQESIIIIPSELKLLIQSSIINNYLESLLLDKICAFYAIGLKYDLILGNPPYLRLQSIQPIWKRTILTKSFLSAVGHFDIYYLFIELGINLLSKKGVLCYVTSNKFIKTGSGFSIRKIIAEKCTIKSLIDFSDSHVFNAMVLPIIIILKSNRIEETFQITNLKKNEIKNIEKHTLDDLINLLINNDEFDPLNWQIESKSIKISRFFNNQPDRNTDNWNFLDQTFSNIIELIEKRSTTNLEQISYKIIVGIKTTANYAFIDDYNYEFINRLEIKIERQKIIEKYGRDLFQPLIQGKDIRNFQIKNNNDTKSSYIFYPHYKDQEGKFQAIPETDIPILTKYLKEKGYYETLKNREYIIKAKRNWYEIWNPKDPELMEKNAKIVFPDISPKNNFAVDYDKKYVDGSAYFIILKEESLHYYRYIVGILNSYIGEFFHKIYSSNNIYAGRFRYWSTNVKNLPIIQPNETKIELVNQLIETVKELETNYSTFLEDQLNSIVFQIFEIDNETRIFIKEWIYNNRIKSL